MICELCGEKEKTRVKWCKYVCDDCEPEAIYNFLPVDTVNFSYYNRRNGNVSVNRIKHLRRRRPHPDGKGEMILTDRLGRPTSKRAGEILY